MKNPISSVVSLEIISLYRAHISNWVPTLQIIVTTKIYFTTIIAYYSLLQKFNKVFTLDLKKTHTFGPHLTV